MLTHFNNVILLLISLVWLRVLAMQEFTGVDQQIIRLLKYIEFIYILSN